MLCWNIRPFDLGQGVSETFTWPSVDIAEGYPPQYESSWVEESVSIVAPAAPIDTEESGIEQCLSIP